jgi:hypothetical protein
LILSKFIDEITQSAKIIDLMKSSYGNYVVQKALKLATGVNKKKLINAVVKQIEKLPDKKLMNKWRMIVDSNLHLNLGLPNNNMNGNLNMSHSSNNSGISNNSMNNMMCGSPIIRNMSPFSQNNDRFSRSLINSPQKSTFFNNLNFYANNQSHNNNNNYYNPGNNNINPTGINFINCLNAPQFSLNKQFNY